MDQQPPPSTAPATTSSTDPSQQQPQPPLPPKPEQPQTPQFQQQPSQPPPSTTPSTLPSPNLNPKPQQPPQPKPTLPTPQPRPAAAFSRSWQQQLSQLTNSSSSSSPSVTSTSTPTLSYSSPSPPSPSQPAPFSGSFGHSFTGASSSNVSRSRPPMQVMGIGSHSQMRPPGISAQHQQRPLQSSLRPPSSSNSQSPTAQNFQGHGPMRVPAVGSSTPSTSQTTQVPNQPWLPSGSQGKPPLPPPSYRPQINSPSLQQRSHIAQQHHSLSTVPQQKHVSSPQLSQPTSLQPQEHFRQQMSPTSRALQSLPHQQASRAQGSINQKPFSLAMVQSSTVQLVNQNKAALTESDESGGKILSKRSIHDLVNQIDPSEKLDPEVEDILVDIAEDFVDSITTFGCSLAKHRKSDTLEAKDILLHLERNWNMTLPGFIGDEIKTYRKPLTNEVHKERLAAIKKSILVSDAPSGKHFVGPVGVNAKGNLGKAAANILGSPNVKNREVT
ncbi:Transcription initiation factor TFIID subunit 12 [Hibiscus syriacus]|uniref:Transcription initiation factor TFIID subunit 12 n=1 Tax=Hibiscus syriacus TaxID=106335 RepID=A0A6A2XGE7_HIBSY|nr:transcription initiation factor TFIID subunit 12-like [Hibiscus syriacus]KAE8661156.1 Transcription initiation factor TFIID subunit 12 [Hibiscus syriacus]